MAGRHHFVSQFHLRGFLDPLATGPNPWVWVGHKKTGQIERRDPKNLAYRSGLFDGQGCLPDGFQSLEKHICVATESPAAKTLRSYLKTPIEEGIALPSEVFVYLAWAAARTVSMLPLIDDWLYSSPQLDEMRLVSPSLFDVEEAKKRPMNQRLVHPEHGMIVCDSIPEIEERRKQGWKLPVDEEIFLHLVHQQAEHFKRLRWKTLRLHDHLSFIIGDRPVVWELGGFLDCPPVVLHDPAAHVFAPITRTLGVFGHSTTEEPAPTPTLEFFNAVIATAALEWIAGPSAELVRAHLPGAAH